MEAKGEWFPVYGSAYGKSGQLLKGAGLLHLEGAPCKTVKADNVMSDDLCMMTIRPDIEKCCKKCLKIANKPNPKSV